MKNMIMYFYNMDIIELRETKNKYIFEYNNHYYSLEKTSINQESLISLLNLLNEKNIYHYRVLFNRNNELISHINDNNYVLLKLDYDFNQKITLDDLENNNFIKYGDINWKKLWSEKIDYFEYQVNQLGLNHPEIRSSFNYYVGLTELAISLLNNISSTNLYVVHKRISSDSTNYDLYNPLNMIIDTKVRDIAGFFKGKFYKNEKVEIVKYFVAHNLNQEEIFLFFIRMIYPSYYFDAYEKEINGFGSLDIKKITNKSSDYELLLKELYNFLKQQIYLPNIEWLR